MFKKFALIMTNAIATPGKTLVATTNNNVPHEQGKTSGGTELTRNPLGECSMRNAHAPWRCDLWDLGGDA